MSKQTPNWTGLPARIIPLRRSICGACILVWMVGVSIGGVAVVGAGFWLYRWLA